MNLPSEIFGEVIVVHAPEELGSEQSDNFQDYMTTLDRIKVVLDLDGTETVDSRGLAALLNAQDQLRETGGDLKLATANGSNRKILEMTRLDESLEVYESVIDAVKSYQGV